MVDIHLIAGLYQLLGFQSAEISKVIGCIDEILMKIVDDIDALVGATSKSLYCIHQYFYLGVILLTDMILLVGTEEEIAFFFIHKPLDYYPRLQKYSIFPNYTSTTSLYYGAAGCFLTRWRILMASVQPKTAAYVEA